MAPTNHPGGYRFLPGIAPYSCGVASMPGHEIAHVTLHRPVPYEHGFGVIEAHLAADGRPKAALCGVELRCPHPYSFEGFARFNAAYARILDGWGLLVAGINTVARTNVAPQVDPPTETVLYGFSYARPCDPSLPPSFVVAGAGELPEGVLEPEAIVRPGETGAEALAQKATFVMGLMEARLRGLGADWSLVTVVDLSPFTRSPRCRPR
jgi:hypothetical protein